MRQAIAFGPFVFSVPLILLFGSLGLGYAAGSAVDRPRHDGHRRTLVSALVVALVAARATYLIEWFDVYRQHPIDLLDLRDGGWNVPLGLLIASLYVMARGRMRGRSTRPGSRPAFVAIAAAMVVYVAGSAGARLFGPPVGTDLTSAGRLLTVDGDPVDLARFHGRPTVVNLWATWCGPCRRELPMLTQAQGAHPGINFVFANQGEDVGVVTAYLASAGLKPANVLLDGASALARASDAQGWPTTLYLDAEGRLVASDTGELTASKLTQRLAELARGKTD